MLMQAVRKGQFKAILAVIAVLGSGFASQAQETASLSKSVLIRRSERKEDRKSLAILIGVQDYTTLPKLKYCGADVALLASVLKDKCGFDTTIVMTDAASEQLLRPTLGNLSRALRQHLTVANSSGYERVFLYFSGHGFRDKEGRLYFSPPDCDSKNLVLTALPHSYVKQMLDACDRVPVKIIALDCCHAGEGRGTGVGVGAEELAIEFQTAKGVFTLASCQADEVSLEWDEQGHGLFTYWLCKGLEGEADLDDDQIIDIYELHRYIYRRVLKTAVDMGRDQTVVLRPGVGVVPIAKLQPAGPALVDDKPQTPRRQSSAATAELPHDVPDPARILQPGRGPSSAAAVRQYTAAAQLQNQKKYEQATQEWKEFLDEFATDPLAGKAGNYLGVCRFKLGHHAEAIDVWRAVVKRHHDAKELQDTYYWLGTVQYLMAQAGEAVMYEVAAETFFALVSEFPDSEYVSRGSFYLGECLYGLDKQQEAVVQYRRILREYPDDSLAKEALYALGVSQEELERYDEAGRTYDQFLKKYPGDTLVPEVVLRSGIALLQTRQYEDALKQFRAVSAMKDSQFAAESASEIARWPAMASFL